MAGGSRFGVEGPALGKASGFVLDGGDGRFGLGEEVGGAGEGVEEEGVFALGVADDAGEIVAEDEEGEEGNMFDDSGLAADDDDSDYFDFDDLNKNDM